MAKPKTPEQLFEVSFRIIEKPRHEQKNLEGIVKVKRKEADRFHNKNKRIYLENWQNWKSSLWVCFVDGERYIIVDSGVIEELAQEIKKYKKLGRQHEAEEEK